MNRYVATFWTYLAALSTFRALKGAGVDAEMTPVPRRLSASCGTCVRYLAQTPCGERMHRDFDKVFLETENGYEMEIENHEAL